MPQASVDPESAPSAPRAARVDRWFVLITCTWLGGVLIGAALLFGLTRSSTRPMSLGRSVFAASNAGSLTGFSWNWGEPADQVSVAATILCLTVLGLLASWLMPYWAFLSLARHRNRPANANPDTGRRWAGAVAPVLAMAVAIAVVSIGGLSPPANGSSFLARIADGVTVLAGAGDTGMEVRSDSPRFWLAVVPLHLVALLGPLAVAAWVAGGGLGLQVRLTLAAGAAAFLLATGVMVITTGATTADEWVTATAIGMDARSAGFLEEAKDMPRVAQVAVTPLALLGGISGVGGGVKVMTAAVLLLGVTRLVRGKRVGAVVGLAGLWVAIVAVIAFVAVLAIIAVMPDMPVDRSWMLACGATGNVALSIDPVVAAGVDAYVLAATMVVSRLGGWIVLWASLRLALRPAEGPEGVVEPLVLG